MEGEAKKITLITSRPTPSSNAHAHSLRARSMQSTHGFTHCWLCVHSVIVLPLTSSLSPLFLFPYHRARNLRCTNGNLLLLYILNLHKRLNKWMSEGSKEIKVKEVQLHTARADSTVEGTRHTIFANCRITYFITAQR
jgi:hypothetical protein